MFASQDSAMVFPPGITTVPLPNNQNLDGFVVNNLNTVFTVPSDGRYYIIYNIYTSTTEALSSSILVNGSFSGDVAVFNTGLANLSHFSSNTIVNLAAGDTIQLRILSSTQAKLINGGGATLEVTRLS